MTGTPLLAVDVDGPLNPGGTSRRPAGYTTHRVRPAGWEEEKRPLRIWLNPAHGPMLQAMADVVEPVWATTWGAEANTVIGPLIGLSEWPVITLGQRPHRDGPTHWKIPAVAAFAAGRPLAWLDDEFRRGDRAWATARSQGGAPTLLVPVPAHLGLHADHLAAVRAWAVHLAADQQGPAVCEARPLPPALPHDVGHRRAR